MDFEQWIQEEIERADSMAQTIEDGSLWVGSALEPSREQREALVKEYRGRAAQLGHVLERVKSK